MGTRPLPAPPDFLHTSHVAGSARAALQALHTCSSETFAKVFGSRQGSAAAIWRKQTHTAVQELLEIGLLKASEDESLRSGYLVTPWEPSGGAFYLPDFSESGYREEVFAPYPATRFFSMLLQARPGDSVLDLGTGSGILLLEAARRGATGLGIDTSARALAFARANAVLNGLEHRVRFERGDITEPPVGGAWGTPTIVLCHPPCEPGPDDPRAFPQPQHSVGGPYGDEVIKKVLDVLSQWSHRPALVQMALLSLGRARTPTGKHLHLRDILDQTARSIGGEVELCELAEPLRLKDFFALALALRGSLQEAREWLSQMEETKGFKTLHLLLANLYLPTPPVASPAEFVRWLPYEGHLQNDECFLWALASPQRNPTNLGAAGTVDISGQHITRALIDIREKEMGIAGQPVDLSWDSERIRKRVSALFRHDTVFHENEPLVVVDVQRGSANEPSLCGVVVVTEKATSFESCSFDKLQSRVEQHLRERVGITRCNVPSRDSIEDRKAEAGESDVLTWDTDVDELSKVVANIQHLPERTEQCISVLSAPNACLSPRRQRFLANIVSDLCVVADGERAHGAELVQHAAFLFGHDLKNRLDELHYHGLRDALRRGGPNATERVEDCFQKLDILYGIVELFRVIGKLTAGYLPHEWAHGDLIDEWPAKFEASHLQKAAHAFHIAVRQGVAPYVRSLRDTGFDFRLREVDSSGPTDVSPIYEVMPIELPPLASTPSPAPILAVLAGLAEMVRNAAQVVTNNSLRTLIRQDYGALHLDYEVRVGQDKVCVTVWNPFIGRRPKSVSLERLSQLYNRLKAVALDPEIQVVDDYPYALAR